MRWQRVPTLSLHMKRIDPATVQKILDTADIVEVVSDFVSLKRRGANYVGLCPFHNERTPSFSVSKSKGICKCFSCGKGGTPVNFIMELEQMTYNEALRYLANKYGIEIKERELSDSEREAMSERESMMAVNDFAMKHFERVLSSTSDGRNIGKAYFRERGLSDRMIERFHLGYSLEDRTNLYDTAIKAGFSERYLLETGLCYKTERGSIQDRFRGRVIYPVFTVVGKVVAFGGRTLRKDKEVAKYVNSPESAVYRKSYEVYGLYQAKTAIVRANKCILVEGYMDVISMHQRGVENVVASSGTSLTQGQINLIHRFTDNVTVIYDSDAAGIKASLRGIDLLLAEGLNVKVLLLPDGDDPDSFAQSHTSSEVESYIAENETDFISFKTRILMADAANDPIARSRAISDIVRSISLVPELITRTVYVSECSHAMNIDEKVLTLQVSKYMAERAEREKNDAIRKGARDQYPDPDEPAQIDVIAEPSKRDAAEQSTADADQRRARFLEPYERGLLRYAVKYGLLYLCDVAVGDDGNTAPMSVIEYINYSMASNDIHFSNGIYAKVFDDALDLCRNGWSADVARIEADLKAKMESEIASGIDEIRNTAVGISNIESMEQSVRSRAQDDYDEALTSAAMNYIFKRLGSSPDDDVRRLSTELVSEKHQLSKIHTKYSKIETEKDRLVELVPMAVYNMMEAMLEWQILELTEEIRRVYSVPNPDFGLITSLMKKNSELNDTKKEFAKMLGERILSPRKR